MNIGLTTAQQIHNALTDIQFEPGKPRSAKWMINPKFDAHEQYADPTSRVSFNGNRYSYWCLQCQDYHARLYLLSASSLNNFVTCNASWFNYKVLDQPLLAPKQHVYINTGKRMHSIEDAFSGWCLHHGLFLPKADMKVMTPDQLTKALTYLKIRFTRPGESIVYHDWIRNTSYIDTHEFCNLRDFFDGDVDKAWKYWLPIEGEFKQVNPYLQHVIVLDRLKVIPKGYLGNKADSLCIVDFKPGKLDKETQAPILISKINEYDWTGNFNRQMKFYAYSLRYPFADPMPVSHVEAIMYKTGQMLREPAKTADKWLEKNLNDFWNCILFKRKLSRDCDWCDYRVSCLNTYKLKAKKDDSDAPAYMF